MEKMKPYLLKVSVKCILFRALLIPVLFITALGCLHAQIDTIYKVAVYEYNRRGYIDSQHPRFKYEIRNLFKRVDTGWVINDTNTTAVYKRVYRGAILSIIKGYKSKDSTSDLEYNISNTMLRPAHAIPLKDHYFSKQFENDDPGLVKKVALLSNNPLFRQKSKLTPYLPSEMEKKMLLDTTKRYMANLFRSNKACQEHSLGYDIDTVIEYVVQKKKEIAIDSLNSFIDNQGNKIINILLPAVTLRNGIYPFGNIYPFDRDCFREDNGFEYYRILCVIQNNGKLFFLRDELKYIDHGDFDNDGKDEFLFWTSRYNHDGYIMYYDNFRKSAKYIWRYN